MRKIISEKDKIQTVTAESLISIRDFYMIYTTYNVRGICNRFEQKNKQFNFLTDFPTHFRITRFVNKIRKQLYHTNHVNGLRQWVERFEGT